jgi:hypothetical protein
MINFNVVLSSLSYRRKRDCECVFVGCMSFSKLQSSLMCCRVGWWPDTVVSEEAAACLFTAEKCCFPRRFVRVNHITLRHLTEGGNRDRCMCLSGGGGGTSIKKTATIPLTSRHFFQFFFFR